MNPIDHQDEYDLWVAGVRAPGVVTIVEAEDSTSWDDKEASGQTGGTTTYKGRALRTFKSRHDLVIDPILGVDEISDWEVFKRDVLDSATRGEKPIALVVYHPDLALQGVKDATPRSVSVLRHDGFGGASVEVAWKEYAPPQPKPAQRATGAGGSGGASSSGGGNRTQGDDMLDEATSEFNSLLDEASAP